MAFAGAIRLVMARGDRTERKGLITRAASSLWHFQATLPQSVTHETSPIEQVRNILADDRNGKRPMIALRNAVELRRNNQGNPWIESLNAGKTEFAEANTP